MQLQHNHAIANCEQLPQSLVELQLHSNLQCSTQQCQRWTLHTCATCVQHAMLQQYQCFICSSGCQFSWHCVALPHTTAAWLRLQGDHWQLSAVTAAATLWRTCTHAHTYYNSIAGSPRDTCSCQAQSKQQSTSHGLHMHCSAMAVLLKATLVANSSNRSSSYALRGLCTHYNSMARFPRGHMYLQQQLNSSCSLGVGQ